jgi:hypothetical protein
MHFVFFDENLTPEFEISIKKWHSMSYKTLKIYFMEIIAKMVESKCLFHFFT